MVCAVAAHGGIPKISTYAVSKAALNALTKIHAYELREARIRYAPTHSAPSRVFLWCRKLLMYTQGRCGGVFMSGDRLKKLSLVDFTSAAVVMLLTGTNYIL